MAFRNTGVPILIYSKHRAISEQVTKLMAPEYDVVHTCLVSQYPSAANEIPAVLRGGSVMPTSSEGSNRFRCQKELRIPCAVVYSGAIPKEHDEAIKASVKGLGTDPESVKWITVDWEKLKSPLRAEQIAQAIMDHLRDVGL